MSKTLELLPTEGEKNTLVIPQQEANSRLHGWCYEVMCSGWLARQTKPFSKCLNKYFSEFIKN